MYCPECRAEYIPGILKCNDCDVALVERIDDPNEAVRTMRGDDGELVVLLVSSDDAMISLAKHLLDSEDIPYQIRGENLRGLYSWGSEGGIFHGVDPKMMMICSGDRDRAVKLMKEHRIESD